VHCMANFSQSYQQALTMCNEYINFHWSLLARLRAAVAMGGLYILYDANGSTTIKQNTYTDNKQSHKNNYKRSLHQVHSIHSC